jgi:ATP-dependent helicase/nuclease subunit A
MSQNPASLPHVMLLANAGSGKTYTLTKRTIALLALGVEPRRIAALTFTKKAAGEFLEKVFLRLADGALDPPAAAQLNREVEELTGCALAQPLDGARCCALLAVVVSQLGELGFGTIDGLFARLARAFPFEAGLPGDFSVLDEAGKIAVRREALAELFHRATAAPDALATLVDLVRRQSRTHAERAVFSSMESMVGNLHGVYLDTPTGVLWGEPKAIWKTDPQPAIDLPRAVDLFREAVLSAAPGLDPEAVEILEERCAEFAGLVPGQTLGKAAVDFVKSKLAGEAKSGALQILRKKVGHVPLTAEVEIARKALLRALWWREISQLLSRSRALHEVLAAFDNIYQGIVRSLGQLTFADVAHLLAGQAGSSDWVSRVGFRLDGKYDHWLLDEFQDTSRLQWRVLQPLIDEVLQDSGGRRSFFYVGDTKQAIYGWRGGDAGLFFSIAGHYNRNRQTILSDQLPDSYRSCAPVIEGVNTVFGNLGGEISTVMGWPEHTVEMWQKAWVPHTVAARNASLNGCFVWKRIPADDEESSPEVDEESFASPQDHEIYKLLLGLEPWRKGISCAVLKRDNQSVANLAAFLQSEGIPVAVEGQTNPCLDNPLGVSLHAAFRFLGSPSDTLSGLVLAGSPLGKALLAGGEDAFRAESMRMLLESGFATVIRHWLSAVDLGGELFLRDRGERIRAVATLFDAQIRPDQGPLDFAACMESFRAQESETPGTVRLMTVHQSKGLTFDVCVVSGLDEMVRDRFTGSLHLGGEDSVQWGMLWPGREWTDADETLRREREKMLADAAYESLCTAYVAFTRARLGMYVFTNALKPTSKARTLDRFLSHAFGEAAKDEGCTLGDPDW